MADHSSIQQKPRNSVEKQRRERESQGFKKLRTVVQESFPNEPSRFEKADILELATSLLMKLLKEEKEREEKEKNILLCSPSTSDSGYSSCHSSPLFTPQLISFYSPQILSSFNPILMESINTIPMEESSKTPSARKIDNHKSETPKTSSLWRPFH